MATNKKTKGIIKVDGRGKLGLLVKVFDQDYVLGVPVIATKLGDCLTDADGYYEVSYNPSKYGGAIIDEDRVLISRGRWKYKWIFGIKVPVKYIPSRYAPRNPDIFIEVWDGPIKLWTSEPHRDVTDEIYTFPTKEFSAEPEPERGILLQIGDVIVDVVCGIMEGTADILESGSEAGADQLDNIFGPGSGNWLRNIGKRTANYFRSGANKIREKWSEATSRTYPMPEELWDTCIKRYRNYKSGILLRHFFPPDINEERFMSERFIPNLVSHCNYIGKINRKRAPFINETKRYDDAKHEKGNWPESFGKNELYSLTFLPMDVESLENGADFLLINGEFFSRDYENGLAFTGSMISCLAREYTMTESVAYKRECEDIISLALDTIEDLELRTGLSGYIIRYHEEGDSIFFDKYGDYVFEIDGSFDVELENSCGPAANINAELLQALRNNGLAHSGQVQFWKQSKHKWLLSDNGQMYQLRKEKVPGDNSSDSDILRVYRAEKRSCGFSDDLYCNDKPEPKNDEEFEKMKRQRLYEPSGDEYVHLLEGLTTAYLLLSGNTEVRKRIRALLARIHRYFQEHYYYLIRPCGHFTSRGFYSTNFEYPWVSLFWKILNVPPFDVSNVNTDQILKKAGLQTTQNIQNEEDRRWFNWVSEPLRINLDPPHSFATLYFLAGLAGGAIFRMLRDIVRKILKDLLDIKINKENWSIVRIWTVHMYSKLSLAGLLCDPHAHWWLAEPFLAWFNTSGLRNTRYLGQSSRNKDEKLNWAWNPTTLAVAVALGKKTLPVWRALCNFLNRVEDGSGKKCYNKDIIKNPKMSRIYIESGKKISQNGEEEDWRTARSMMFPVSGMMIRAWGYGEEDSNGDIIPKKLIGREEAGGHSVLECMWPTAVLGYTCTKQFDASINKLPDSDIISKRLNSELSKRSARLSSLPHIPRPVFIIGPQVKNILGEDVELISTTLLQKLIEDRNEIRVKVLSLLGGDIQERTKNIAHQIRKAMDSFQGDQTLQDLSFDIVSFSIGGLEIRHLLLLEPSALGIYWPNNLIMLGVPNHGATLNVRLTGGFVSVNHLQELANWMKDNIDLSLINARMHHHDVRIFTCAGNIENAEYDGFTTVSSIKLRANEAVNIASQIVIPNLAHDPVTAKVLGLSSGDWYFEDARCIENVLDWLSMPPEYLRNPYILEE
jgi:hypothetical protein